MAISFNGSTDYYNMGPGTATDLDIQNNAPFSLMCWINFTSLAPATQAFISKGFLGTNTAYQFTQESSGPLTAIGSFVSSAIHNTIWNPSTWLVSTWHHIYGDYTGASGSPASTWRIYVDGAFIIGTSDVVGPVSVPTRNFQLGAIDTVGGTGSATNPFGGCMADAAIFNGPLTNTEITNLGNGSIRPSSVASQTMLGYWTMDTALSILPDLSGKSNPGNIHGSPTTCGTSPPYTVGATFVLMGQICA